MIAEGGTRSEENRAVRAHDCGFDVCDDTARLIEVAIARPRRIPLRDRLMALEATGLGGSRAAEREFDPRPPFPYGKPDIETINYDLLCAQHDEFVAMLQQEGVVVTELDPVASSPAQIFARDIAFVIDDVLHVARPSRADRLAELAGIGAILNRGGSARYMGTAVEGGDVLVHARGIVIGMSDKTNHAAAAEIRSVINPDRRMTVVRLAMKDVVHLDVVFNIVNPELGLIFRPALDDDSLRRLSNLFDLIEVPASDMSGLGINCLSLDHYKVAVSRPASTIVKELEKRRITTIPVAFGEIVKAGGGLRCGTLPLRRGRPCTSCLGPPTPDPAGRLPQDHRQTSHAIR